MSAAAPSRAPGLTSAEAAEALTRVGPNLLPSAEQVPVWRRLATQFVHFFALLLWVAATLAVVGGMPALGAAIVAVVLVNGVPMIALSAPLLLAVDAAWKKWLRHRV